MNIHGAKDWTEIRFFKGAEVKEKMGKYKLSGLEEEEGGGDWRERRELSNPLQLKWNWFSLKGLE